MLNTTGNLGKQFSSEFIATHKIPNSDRICFRLWGNHGQTSLENSRVCLINASSVGTETLKSMVLPGEYIRGFSAHFISLIHMKFVILFV